MFQITRHSQARGTVITSEESLSLSPTYHVILIGSNFPAVFVEIYPWLWISLGLTHHLHRLAHPALQDTFRMDQDFGRIFSSPSSC